MSAFLEQPPIGPSDPVGPAVPFAVGALGTLLRHAGDLSLLSNDGQHRWTDALLSEVRAHLGGCLNAVETALIVQLGENWLARPVEALGQGYCRLAAERHPALLSPDLIEHFRQRAAAALMLRTRLIEPATLHATADDALPGPDPAEGALGDALAALRLSVDGWHDPHPLDAPMRPDLPADIYADLVWTAAALIVRGLGERMGVGAATATPALGHAAEMLIARHDEQHGPFARASYVAVLMENVAMATHMAGDAAQGRDLLRLGALGAHRLGIDLSLGLSLLIDGSAQERAAFARLAGLSDEGYIALLTGLAPARDDAADALLPGLISAYRGLTEDAALAVLAPWRGPEALVAKLARVGPLAR